MYIYTSDRGLSFVIKSKSKLILQFVSYRDGCPEEILENIKKRKN
jgi:hypothetical protein